MNKEETIEYIKTVDIKAVEDWQDCLETIDNLFARGYMACFSSRLLNNLGPDDEEYREEILSALHYNIWPEQGFNVKIF